MPLPATCDYLALCIQLFIGCCIFVLFAGWFHHIEYISLQGFVHKFIFSRFSPFSPAASRNRLFARLLSYYLFRPTMFIAYSVRTSTNNRATNKSLRAYCKNIIQYRFTLSLSSDLTRSLRRFPFCFYSEFKWIIGARRDYHGCESRCFTEW